MFLYLAMSLLAPAFTVSPHLVPGLTMSRNQTPSELEFPSSSRYTTPKLPGDEVIESPCASSAKRRRASSILSELSEPEDPPPPAKVGPKAARGRKRFGVRGR